MSEIDLKWDSFEDVYARRFTFAVFEKRLFIRNFYGYELDEDEIWEMAQKVKRDEYPDVPEVILEHFNPNNANYKRHNKQSSNY